MGPPIPCPIFRPFPVAKCRGAPYLAGLSTAKKRRILPPSKERSFCEGKSLGYRPIRLLESTTLLNVFCTKNESLTHDDNDAKDEGDEDRGEQADHPRRCQPGGGRGGGGGGCGLRGRREGRRWDLNGKLNSGKNKLGIPLTKFVKQSRRASSADNN